MHLTCMFAAFVLRFSGVTKDMLANVSTSLSDVQNSLEELLPPDAILCGQSLNCDLVALKVTIIDLFKIYNVFNNWKKYAYKIFLQIM